MHTGRRVPAMIILYMMAAIILALIALFAAAASISAKVNKLGSSVDDWVGPIQGSARRPNGPIERKSLSG